MSSYASILKNTSVERYHPIYFRPSPRPSDDFELGKVCRHRSFAHHTDGFATLDEAIASIGSEDWFTGYVLDWDGTGIPATTLDLVHGGPAKDANPKP